MQLVKNEEEVRQNCLRIAKYLNGSGEEREYALALIKQGRCFLPVVSNGELAFYPSRFIGYKKNSIKSTASRGDGRDTNRAIYKIFDKEVPQRNMELDNQYVEFCSTLSIDVTFRQRRFWTPRQYVISSLIADIQEIETKDASSSTKQRLIDARLGQGKFRAALIYEWRCCPLSKCSELNALKASHIKPWSISTDNERVDPKNGLLLSANYDALFDKYLISFDENGNILVAKRLLNDNLKKLGVQTKTSVKLDIKRSSYMMHHRKKFRILDK